MTYQLHHGDCLNIMPLIERESVDAIICDPPYGLGFMGKDWDHGVPGMHFWLEALRCAKPGAYLLAFGGTRTFHRLAVAIEDAGWEIRDDIALLASMDDKQRAFFDSLNPNQQQDFLDTFAANKTTLWITGQGFPKSHDVSKAIDREAGAEREVIGRNRYAARRPNPMNGTAYNYNASQYDISANLDETLPATPAAAEWDGWGTALKPAWEPIIVARKPLQGTVAENVQRYGTGAMNIDACRIDVDDSDPNHRRDTGGYASKESMAAVPNAPYNSTRDATLTQGRWPANLIHDGSAEVLAGFPMTTSGALNAGHKQGRGSFGLIGGDVIQRDYGNDTGSAARFFYCAKASKQDRDEGLEDLQLRDASIGDQRPSGSMSQRIHSDEGRPDTLARNHHPTVKPTALMRYLCRLVTPPNGTILDPFMGSGSTGKAAMLEGFNFIGIDTEIEYVEIAARRIEHACEKMGIVVDQPMMFETKREKADRPKQLILL